VTISAPWIGNQLTDVAASALGHGESAQESRLARLPDLVRSWFLEGQEEHG